MRRLPGRAHGWRRFFAFRYVASAAGDRSSAPPALQPSDGLCLHRRRQDSGLSKSRRASGIRARASRSEHNRNGKRRACAKEGRRGWHAHCEIVLSAPDEEGCRKPEDRSRTISRPSPFLAGQEVGVARRCGTCRQSEGWVFKNARLKFASYLEGYCSTDAPTLAHASGEGSIGSRAGCQGEGGSQDGVGKGQRATSDGVGAG